jgi:hypothetical protein
VQLTGEFVDGQTIEQLSGEFVQFTEYEYRRVQCITLDRIIFMKLSLTVDKNYLLGKGGTEDELHVDCDHMGTVVNNRSSIFYNSLWTNRVKDSNQSKLYHIEVLARAIPHLVSSPNQHLFFFVSQ